jgi:hypothetical protein
MPPTATTIINSALSPVWEAPERLIFRAWQRCALRGFRQIAWFECFCTQHAAGFVSSRSRGSASVTIGVTWEQRGRHLLSLVEDRFA